jgi:hypothetical protein
VSRRDWVSCFVAGKGFTHPMKRRRDSLLEDFGGQVVECAASPALTPHVMALCH